MDTINLLPWREWTRKNRVRQFWFGASVSGAVSVIIIIGSHFGLAAHIHRQTLDNQRVSDALIAIDKDYRRVKQSHDNRRVQQEALVRAYWLNDLQRVLPPAIALRRIQQNGRHIMLEGEGVHHDDVVMLLNQLEQAAWVKWVQMSHITRRGEQAAHDFSLTLELRDAT